jgi:uncharacterized protein GlcG (DUF336 family)
LNAGTTTEIFIFLALISAYYRLRPSENGRLTGTPVPNIISRQGFDFGPRRPSAGTHHKEEKMSLSRFVLGLVFALFAAGAMAQDRPPYGQDVNLDLAKKIAAGAAAESKKNGWRMAIAVVDNHGFLVYYERMDDTQTASVQIALDKAKTAATFRRPSKAFEDGIAKGRVALLGLSGATPIEGGVPIMAGGKVIGGVGVSGANSDQDAQAAMAGLKAAGL